MSLPKAVEEAAKKADEMLQQMQEVTDGGKTEDPAPDKPEGTEPEKPFDPEPAKDEPKPEGEPKPPAVDPKEYERLKQAHAVLQGKYNAEVPRLHHEVEDLKAQLAEAKKVSAPKGETKPENLDDVLKQLAEEYGDEFANKINTAINRKVDAAISGVKSEFEGVKTSVAKSREERFLAELSGLVPTWREIFDNPEFSTFLDGEDAYSGRSLRELALEANKAMNAKRLARFYTSFLNSQKVEEIPPAKKEEEKPKDKREGLIAPTGKGKEAEPAGEKPDLIKASDMEKFYRDVTRGVYAYRPKEKEAIETRINNALAKGWIVEG